MNNEQEVEKYGNLKMTMELEGDGYFFYGYGLNSEYQDDQELVEKFKAAEKAVDEFKTLVEKKIIDLGGDPSEWVA